MKFDTQMIVERKGEIAKIFAGFVLLTFVLLQIVGFFLSVSLMSSDAIRHGEYLYFKVSQASENVIKSAIILIWIVYFGQWAWLLKSVDDNVSRNTVFSKQAMTVLLIVQGIGLGYFSSTVFSLVRGAVDGNDEFVKVTVDNAEITLNNDYAGAELTDGQLFASRLAVWTLLIGIIYMMYKFGKLVVSRNRNQLDLV